MRIVGLSTAVAFFLQPALAQWRVLEGFEAQSLHVLGSQAASTSGRLRERTNASVGQFRHLMDAELPVEEPAGGAEEEPEDEAATTAEPAEVPEPPEEPEVPDIDPPPAPPSGGNTTEPAPPPPPDYDYEYVAEAPAEEEPPVETPEIPDEPDDPIVPDVPDEPVETPDDPVEVPDAPGTTATPAVPDTTAPPVTPDDPTETETPADPDTPAEPITVDDPGTTETPSTPEEDPGTTDDPATTGTSSTPSTPDSPSTPLSPPAGSGPSTPSTTDTPIDSPGSFTPSSPADTPSTPSTDPSTPNTPTSPSGDTPDSPVDPETPVLTPPGGTDADDGTSTPSTDPDTLDPDTTTPGTDPDGTPATPDTPTIDPTTGEPIPGTDSPISGADPTDSSPASTDTDIPPGDSTDPGDTTSGDPDEPISGASPDTPPGQETPEDTPDVPDAPEEPAEVDPAGVGVNVVDTDPEPEDFSFTVVSDSCADVLEAIENVNAEFAQIIEEVIPDVTPADVYTLFGDKNASITVLVPPRTSTKGLLYSYDAGDVTAEEVRDVVLVHVIPQLLKFDDLVALPSDELVPTLLDGASLQPSLAGASSGSNAGEPGSGSIGLQNPDIDACAPDSILHTIKGLLLPDGFELPASANPRALDGSDDLESRTVDSGGDGGSDDSGLSLGAWIGIGAAAVAALLLLITILVIVFTNMRNKEKKAEDEFRAAAAAKNGKGYPPGHPMFYHGAGGPSEFGSVASGAPPPPGAIPSGFEMQYNAPPPHGSFVSASSGHPPYPPEHPAAAGAPYGVQQYGPSHVSAGWGTGNNTNSSVASDQGRRGLGVQSYGSDTYHENNMLRDSPNVTNGSGAGGYSPMGSAMGSAAAAPSGMGSVAPSGHGGYAQSSMSGGSTNPANYTASSHRTYNAPHGMTTFNQTSYTSNFTQAVPPTNSSTPDEIKAWVEHQLDLLGDTPLMNRFVLLGPNERRRGGQAVVAFARSTRDQALYALKFFVMPQDFASEVEVYSNSPLGKLLPRLEGIVDNKDGQILDPAGHKLPPCIIMERGESLDEWSRRRKPDMWAAMPVLANVAKRLQSMHEAGFAHRDLKPANVMWLPRENQWTLIDFGCAAQIVDAWALGVMVYELLTGKQAFDVFLQGRDAVVAQLLGEEPLPWENMSTADRHKLGAFRGPIMELLNRDPAKRPSMPQFYHNCNSIFTTSTTYTPGTKNDTMKSGNTDTLSSQPSEL